MRLLRPFLIFLSLIVASQTAMAQTVMERLITPGPLSSAHAKLESQCQACHESFSREAQNSKCLSCHRGINEDVSKKLGFHGKSSARGQPCKSCHSEHHGRGAQLIKFSRAGFNHNLTDYPLVGGHAKVACAGCHGNATHYRGLQTTCANCHSRKDPHQGRLGRNCQNCHTVQAWKSRLPFDHNKTGFTLVGRHKVAACMSCHVGQRWNGTPATCISCHAKNDVHRGSRGTNCASCHNPNSWNAATFNHNRDTAFPLVGRHASAACAGCHGKGNAIRKPGRACISCHARDDAHKGSRGTNCTSCHSPNAWNTTSFDHNTDTAFPLVGRHAAATCAGCHGPGNSIRKPGRACISCHAKDDSHKGRNGTECAKCHSPKSWQATSFDHNRQTRFPLIGKHARAKCDQCHGVGNTVKAPPMECVGCHQDDDVHKGTRGTTCNKCHNNNDWKITSFNHDTMTRFPLAGGHKGLLCIACHKDPAKAERLPVECVSCHAKDDPHNKRLGPDCASCHNVSDWKVGVLFDHSLTRFPLLGKHQPLTCEKCHADKSFAAKGVACASCHADDKHKGALGTPASCANCHNVFDWKQWRFDHDSQTKFPLTGKHRGLVCSACHTKAGDPAKMGSVCVDCHKRDDVHRGEFGADCGQCHVTDDFQSIKVQRE